MNSIDKVNNFYPQADQLRQYFDQQFENPLIAHENRFVWDYWNVPDQYCTLRTPAYHYFPEDMYNQFHDHLVNWGQQNLGCFDISPPWLSCYVEGCFQNWHSDSPHGPWAFVYSLTPWSERVFTGGETLIFKPETLDYWAHYNPETGLEKPQLMQSVAPEFNQLTLFDPRLPHRVEEVRGVRDPRQARLVIHGWFTEPSPFISENLDEEEMTDRLNEIMQNMLPDLQDWPHLTGVISVRVDLKPFKTQVLMNHLSSTDKSDKRPLSELIHTIEGHLQQAQLPEQEDAYFILPIIY